MSHILVLEDRPIERKFLVTLLRAAGHRVSEAADGAEGLALAEAVPPDLVISDILMPSMDGYEFARRVRETRKLADTRVMFYSATYHEREALALAAQCGVSDVLTKPSEPRAILAKIKAVLSGSAHPAQPAMRSEEDESDRPPVAAGSLLATKIEDLKANEYQMAAIIETAHQVSAERDPQAVLQKLCDAAREVTLAEQASITIRREDGTLERVVWSGSWPERLRTMELPDVNGLVFRRAFEDRVPVRMQNPGGRPEAIGLPASHPLTYSIMILPLASPTRVYACLGLRNKLGADAFSQRDEDVTQTLATLAGAAYENARLYADLSRHSAALEQEVGERARIENTLRDREEQTGFALAAAHMGIWWLDLATQRLAWSDTMAPVFGLRPDQAPTTADEFAALLHADDRAAVISAMQAAVEQGHELSIEFRAVRPDGRHRWVHGRAHVVRDSHGAPLKMLGVSMDVSDRKSLEEQLMQAQKMEAIGQLAGGVAHDFNNLLTAIHGYGEFLLESLSEGDSRRADVDEILKAADRAGGLTRQLLTFSRKQVIQPTVLDLNGLIKDTSKMLRRLIGEDIDLVTVLAPNLAPVLADAGQIEQIVMNLSVNARDAMPRGGRIIIETANIELNGDYATHHVDVRPGSYAMLAVTDNGSGIDEHTRGRIFEPFFTTKERGRGTGLGLATVYGIVRQSGGYIWVYSEPGHGATFKVYLPGVERQRKAVAAVETVHSAGGSETVLLVEDEPSVRSLSRAILERAGYRVKDAIGPKEAVELFARQPDGFELLVTDVIMPGMSGPALYDHLSAQQAGLRVLYMSGYTDDAMVRNAGLPEGFLFLQKPFTTHGLLCKVREALDR